MDFLSKIKRSFAILLIVAVQSCTTLESTVDSTWDSISEAGDFIYDSVNFWEEDEPEQSEAIIIEEAVEVPEYALPDNNYFENEMQQNMTQQPQNFQPQANISPYYDPIYRSQRQYYYVGPNGTPMLAPPPPPFPQYSIDQAPPLPYSYSNNLGAPRIQSFPPNQNFERILPKQNSKPVITLEEEMELFGIQNDCVRVKEDFVNGGFMCDDYD